MFQKKLIDIHLKEFVIEALKKMEDVSLVIVIKEALNCVDSSVFAKLLECPNVIALETTQHAPYLRLLRLFSRGTYLDYLENKKYLPQLSEPQIKKLQYLTIVTLANKMKIISYDVLLKELNIDNVKDLENLIIEAIHLNLISGELNQKDNCLEVNWTVSRDVGANDVDTLQQFSDSSENVLSPVQACVVDTKQSVPKRPKRSASVENEFARLKKVIITQIQGEEIPVDTSGPTKNV